MFISSVMFCAVLYVMLLPFYYHQSCVNNKVYYVPVTMATELVIYRSVLKGKFYHHHFAVAV